jgi:predicted CopG family antitoxin
MPTISVTIKSDLHEDLKSLGNTLGLRSFSEVIQYLKNNYLDAPEDVPVEVFDRKRDIYFDSYPNEFREATQIRLGVTVPEEFDAVFEEVISELINQKELASEEMLVLQCSRCNHE